MQRSKTQFDAAQGARAFAERIRSGVRFSPPVAATSSAPTTGLLAKHELEVKRVQQPYPYQVTLFKRAQKENVVAFLGTGMGKTMIGVLAVQDHIQRYPRGEQKVVICAPSIFLVAQLAAVLRANCRLPSGEPPIVGEFFGQHPAGGWGGAWAKPHVLVFTPQLLVECFMHGRELLGIQRSIGLVIIDECHHCVSGEHPMGRVLEVLTEDEQGYVSDTVRFLGLTATPLPVSKLQEVPRVMALLCQKMKNAKVVTSAESMAAALQKGNQEFVCEMDLYLQGLTGADYMYENLSGEAAARVSELFGDSFPKSHVCWKLARLVAVLSRPFEQAIVFVQRRETAHQLALELRSRKISAQSLVGIAGKARKLPNGQYGADEEEIRNQLSVFKAFSAKQFKVLVATAAAEEGIDVPQVDLVVAYDGSVSLRSFVQSKGRCRAEKSRFLVLCDTMAAVKKVEGFQRLEKQILDCILSEAIDCDQVDVSDDGCNYRESYVVPKTGAKVDERGAIALLHQVHQSVCQGDTPALDCFVLGEKRFRAVLQLANFFPLNLRNFESPVFERKNDCRRNVCMQAIKALHKSGWMSDALYALDLTAGLSAVLGANPAVCPRMVNVQFGPTAEVTCKVHMVSEALRIDVTFWMRLPGHLVVDGYDAVLAESFGDTKLSLSVDNQEVPAWNSALGRVQLHIPASIVDEETQFLRKYSVDGSCNVLLIDRAGIASKPFPNSDRAATFVEYFRSKHGVAIDLNETLWRVVRVHTAPEKSLKKTMEIPESLLREKLPTERVQFWVQHCVPELVHHMQERALLARACAALGTKSLASECLVPSSRNAARNLERLEFLGDTVLKLIAAQWLYQRYPFPESVLTQMRSILTCNATLAAAFVRLGLVVDPRNEADFWRGSWEHVELPQKCCADVVEAIIGAVFEANGFAACFDFCRETLRLFEQESFSGLCVREERLAFAVGSEKLPPIASEFKDKSLLGEALTHSSMRSSKAQNYNRLEFLGDAVLDYFAAQRLFKMFPNVPPGKLSMGKSCLVSTQTLARISRRNGLVGFIFHQLHGLSMIAREEENIPPFNMWLGSDPKMFADVLEAVIGAFYVDRGCDLAGTERFVDRLCGPEWNELLVNPFVPEPTHALRELLPHADLQWSEPDLALIVNGFEATRLPCPNGNWKRVLAARTCAMLTSSKDLLAKL
jgi:dsRNA-specific ribonuclease/ERCC4-related helicase